MNADVRIMLRIEIENILEMFPRTLALIPEDIPDLPSRDPTCTNGELLYGMATSPLVIKSILKRNFGTWSHLVLQKLVTGPLGQPGNELLTRSRAQNSNPWSFTNDFNKTLIIPYGAPLLSGPVTVEQFLHYVKNHFDLHRQQINPG